jgi:hypothetical protein
MNCFFLERKGDGRVFFVARPTLVLFEVPDQGSRLRQPCSDSEPLRALMQLRVLRFGLFQDWNVGVGILPEREKLLILSFGFARIGGQSMCPS